MRIKLSNHVDWFVKCGRQYVNLFEFPKQPDRFVRGLTFFAIGFLAGILVANWIISNLK